MADYSYKKSFHTKPSSMVNKVFSGLYSETIYSLYAKEDPEYCVVHISTLGTFGPASGRAVWSVKVNQHNWAQEIAEGIWNYSDDPQIIGIITESIDPSNVNCRELGWSCQFPAEIQWDDF